MINREFKLKEFDGPLDLLLTLIGKAQIDIRDIFVSEITDQYLDIVRNAPDLDMDEASDFLLMAATLLEIKSRAMLPRPPKTEDETDPETELIRRLEEYKLFRETAESMKAFENAAKSVFTKLPEEYPLPPQEVELTGLTLAGLQEHRGPEGDLPAGVVFHGNNHVINGTGNRSGETVGNAGEYFAHDQRLLICGSSDSGTP